MPQQFNPTVENHFIEGFKTEFTGLNFPDNAATSTSNCVYTLIGDVNRRGGINYETNFNLNNINVSSVAHSSYRWTNVGGDGNTNVLVKQIGNILYFFLSTNATTASPLSTTLLSSQININTFQALNNTNNTSITECQFADGNGYLIVYHKDCDPFFCTYNSASQTITPTIINLQIRDFVGIPESIASNFRPVTLTPEHQYNLQNQGWTSGPAWTANITVRGGAFPAGTYNIGSTITIPISTQTNTTSIVNGSEVILTFSNTGAPGLISPIITLIVSSYVTPFTILTGTIASSNNPFPITVQSGDTVTLFNGAGQNFVANTIVASLANVGFITKWQSVLGNYPSNSDVWWLYKDTTDTFNPLAQIASVQQAFGPAPQGYYVLNAFNQQRSALSGVNGITGISTTVRPSTGCWFQGRVFYAGVNSSQQATGDEPYTTWTENIYFSQTVVHPTDFGLCYQTNDPTSQTTFNLLPTDGGIINIQGCGAIYKLFALRYGLLVFAANGIWFVSGSQGVGFAANDYTIIKISNIQTTSSTSFVDVLSYPFFWNAEGIYVVTPTQQAGSAHSPDIQLDVKNLTLGTILTYYQGIPLTSTKYARGTYDSLNYIVEWMFRSTPESGISNRYSYDSVLCFNTVNKAFYTYSLPTTSNSTICDVQYIQNPAGLGFPLPVLKYITMNGSNLTFSEENDFSLYLDFFSENAVGYNFTSTFTTGYKLAGQGLRKFEVPYIYFFSRNPSGNSFTFQSIWDYAGTGNSGRWSTIQRVTNSTSDFTMLYRRLRVRGRGMAVQFKISSIQGQPFDLMGWSVWSYANTSIS